MDDAQYSFSINDPQAFWSDIATQTISWFIPWHTVSSGDFHIGKIEWFLGAELNASYNCLDRHLEKNGDRIALIAQGNVLEQSETITYRALHQRVCQFANLLKSRGIQKGDRVAIYMPMVIDAVVAMLACARIGAVHTVVFGGFSAESLHSRIVDAGCAAVITADVSERGAQVVPLKEAVDTALQTVNTVHSVFVFQLGKAALDLKENRDVNATLETPKQSSVCAPEAMQSEDPLFILYTSGSTGKPKGVLHTTGGYLTQAAFSHRLVFDLKENDVYFCTADIGWITGHTYVVYGPLCNASTIVIDAGVPTYPNASRYWDMVDRYQISILYTSPTAIRSLMQYGDAPLAHSKRSSLRVLGSVGEPINPEAWEWYSQKVGQGRCPIMDTWWQTETGSILMAPLVGKNQQKPGAAMRPLYGVVPKIVETQGVVMDQNDVEGALVIEQPWPGMMRSIYGDHARFVETYLKPNPGFYTTGDGARRDAEGDYWILGRLDDVLKVSGHRLGTAEIESALVLDPAVAEAAVVSCPDAIKGEGIYAFVVLMKGQAFSDGLKKRLVALVRKEVGPVATPNEIQCVDELPKTRSGKIMRRILRKITHGEKKEFGDLSTLANPGSVQKILKLIDHSG